MSPNVRGISRRNRIPTVEVIELPERKLKHVISKFKFFGITLFATFIALTAVNEGSRAWLGQAGVETQKPGNFSVPQVNTILNPVTRPPVVVTRAGSSDQVQLIRESNRYQVDMARENNRLINNAMNCAERITSRFAR
jgi:hypothetical protein